ncbi:unnamed protein product [Allacma fusca]|uniref:Uncharacterized protein n=1 Tax=Allacma fusca TaxID=39272 RepID=A0A8J2PPI3_9HEXA|nr:unnamed protein product [Allacma fusca]
MEILARIVKVFVVALAMAHFSSCVPLTMSNQELTIVPFDNSTFTGIQEIIPTTKQICLETQTCCKPSQGAPNSRCRCRDRANLFGVPLNCDITTFPLIGSAFMICHDINGSGTCPP